MNHKQKKRLARRLSGMQSGMFRSREWLDRKAQIAIRVARRERPELIKRLGL